MILCPGIGIRNFQNTYRRPFLLFHHYVFILHFLFVLKIDTLTKEVRRDSKGFENFDDYFEESDGNDTTVNTAGEKTNDESIGDDSATEVKKVIKTLKIIIFVKYLLKKLFLNYELHVKLLSQQSFN